MTDHLPYELTEIQKAIHHFRIDKILSVAGEAKGLLGADTPTVLDMGCGRGELLEGLGELGYETFGLDIDPRCVELSSAHGQIMCGDLADAAKIFEGRKFDLIVTSHALEHTANPLKVLLGMRELMAGYALIAVPNVFFSFNMLKQAFLGRRPATNEGHFFEWDPSNFENLLRRHAQMKIVSWNFDWVKMVPTRMLRKAFYRIGLLKFWESRFGPWLFPHMSESLIVLCEKNDQGEA